MEKRQLDVVESIKLLSQANAQLNHLNIERALGNITDKEFCDKTIELRGFFNESFHKAIHSLMESLKYDLEEETRRRYGL